MKQLDSIGYTASETVVIKPFLKMVQQARKHSKRNLQNLTTESLDPSPLWDPIYP